MSRDKQGRFIKGHTSTAYRHPKTGMFTTKELYYDYKELCQLLNDVFPVLEKMDRRLDKEIFELLKTWKTHGVRKRL